MSAYQNILVKLNGFIRKHYTQKLIKGGILFITLGVLFFLTVMGVEYFLWLSSTGRFILLLLFVAAACFLLFAYVLTPIFYLFRIKKGITAKDAAQMIGTHFPNVGDKLINLLDLAGNNEKSELLLASIEQRSQGLSPVPFTKAIDHKEALRYSKYVLIPIVIIALLYISGNWNSFFGSYDRVVNYGLAYEPPAPFHFELLSTDLNVIESEPFTFQVTTKGEVRPESVYVVLDGKEILLQEDNGMYQYTLSPPLNSADFNFRANKVVSKNYYLNALKAPAIVDFNIKLNYPAYLKRQSEVLNSTGNAIIPEGTTITWDIEGQDTELIRLVTKDTVLSFLRDADTFTLTEQVYSDLAYQLTTSNKNVKDYEKLDYNFKVIKDAHPTIKVEQLLDSLDPNVSYYTGEATDDYGIAKIDLVYFEKGAENATRTVSLSAPNNGYSQFYYTFPSGLQLDASKNYGFYFIVTDNDGIHGGKTTKSHVFSQTLLDDDELKNKDLESQQKLIDELDNSLERTKEQKEFLEELNNQQKEKNSLNFNDQNQVKDFLKKQERQEELMQKFSKELKDNLNKGNKDDKLNQLLQERLERQEMEAKRNQELVEELNKVVDKINKEELAKRLEELGKKQQNSERSLEQLLELTKRYYVTEKAAQLGKDLEKLSEKQNALSGKQIGKDYQKKEQEGLNKDFENISEELNELQNDNGALKKPIDLNIDDKKTESVKEDQQNALEQIEKHENAEQTSQNEEMKKSDSGAKKNQKSAAGKMKEMSEELSASSVGGGDGSSAAEDAEMLRQILDNLIIFSFKQENLFDRLSAKEQEDVSQYSATVRSQKELRGLFEHVDDSLFALSLRQVDLSEFVNEQITEVYYNIDKSLESMADGQMYQGISYQKYVLTASNSLADFLAKIMDNMNQSMQMGKGSGNSQEGFQLPDIIKSQGGLGEKMGESGSKGQQGGQGKQGEQGENGQNGKGQKGEGQGENGKEGQNGQGHGGKNGKVEGDNSGQGADGKGGSGNDGNQGEGRGGLSEGELQEIYEIYQQQQRIRQELEKQLENMLNSGDRKLGEKLVRQMEDFENDLLENGITQRTISKANTIQYELLKLENAALKQGKKAERESIGNQKDFTNPITTKPSLLDNYRNEVEILNRQALPLRQNFQNKVKEYFKDND